MSASVHSLAPLPAFQPSFGRDVRLSAFLALPDLGENPHPVPPHMITGGASTPRFFGLLFTCGKSAGTQSQVTCSILRRDSGSCVPLWRLPSSDDYLPITALEAARLTSADAQRGRRQHHVVFYGRIDGSIGCMDARWMCFSCVLAVRKLFSFVLDFVCMEHCAVVRMFGERLGWWMNRMPLSWRPVRTPMKNLLLRKTLR